MAYDVSVIGLGRVGLPLALCFADAGLSVLGVDNDTEKMSALREGRMPFKEPGTQEMLDRLRGTGRFELSERVADAAAADAIVLTLGTPALSPADRGEGAEPWHIAGLASPRQLVA